MKNLLVIILLSFSLSFAQEISLKGRVTDSISNLPVEGAAVLISHNHLAYSNSEGYFIINGLAEGNYSVKVMHLGYSSYSGNINLPADNQQDFHLQPSPIELNEIIVSTSRFDKNLRSSPYTELVVSSSEIKNRTFQSIPEALKNEPGISVISEGVWGTEVSIRGLNRESVVALIDGNRIATSTDVAARFSLVDINDVERIEVIKGGSSSIYGSGATGGIVNIITKAPAFSNNFNLRGNISSGFNSVNNASATSGSIYSGGSFWASKVSGAYRKAGNIQTPVGKIKNSQYEDYSFSGNLSVLPLQNHLLKFNYQLFKANDVGIPGSSIFPNNADVRYPEEKRELFSAGYEIQNITSFIYKLSIKYSHQLIERDVENIPHIVQNIPATPALPARRVSVLKITPGADHNNNNFQFYGNLLLGERNILVAGIDYWDRRYNGERQRYQLIETLDGQGNITGSTNKVIGEKPLPDSKFRSIGFFVQDDAELIKDKLSFSLSARIDKIDVSGERTVNPIYEITNGTVNNSPAGQKIIWDKIEDNDYSYSSNLGLRYSILNNLDLTMSFGYSFRSPSLEERFQYIDQGSYVRIGNPNLNSETGRSVDFGIRHYSTRVKIISSFFFSYFDNLVAEIPGRFEERNAFIKTNIGESRLYGFDINADYNFYRDFIIHAAAAYVKGDDITANGNLPDIAPLNGSLGIKLNLVNRLYADLSSSFFAAQNRTAEGELSTPGYIIFNAALYTSTINFSLMNLIISAGVDNIFNIHYRNHLSSNRGSIMAEPGRNLYLKLTMNF